MWILLSSEWQEERSSNTATIRIHYSLWSCVWGAIVIHIHTMEEAAGQTMKTENALLILLCCAANESRPGTRLLLSYVTIHHRCMFTLCCYGTRSQNYRQSEVRLLLGTYPKRCSSLPKHKHGVCHRCYADTRWPSKHHQQGCSRLCVIQTT